MKTTTIEIEDRVDELLAVLDRDIQHMQESLSKLDELRSSVVKRDDATLGKLLESIQSESDNYKNNELKRQSIRKDLAAVLNCSPGQVTLSRLEAELTGTKKAQVGERKTILRSLAEELKKEHLSTAMLLSDCARFNKLLLKSIFELGRTATITYDSNGATRRQTDTAFVNLQY